MTRIIIGSDHRGLLLKEEIKLYLIEEGYQIIDNGCYTDKSCDYPEIAESVCKAIHNEEEKGILISETGIGMSIKANRFCHIRCALCSNELMSEMSRKHSNANVIALGSKITDSKTACNIVNIFLKTEFEGGRHLKRINKLNYKVTKDIADIL